MRKITFAFCIVLLLLIVGCSNTDEQIPAGSASVSDIADEQASPESTPEPVALSVSDLNDLLAALDLTKATLTYHGGDTEATYSARAAIRAESYIGKLKSFTWKEYTPASELNENDARFYQLTAPNVTITTFLGRYDSNHPLHLITDDNEGWFFLPHIETDQATQVSSMIYDIFSSWYAEAETASLYEGTGVPLTTEELNYFDEFTGATWTEYFEEWGGNITWATEISCFFTSLYNDPRDMDAVEFLYYCPDQGTLEIEDEAEWQLVQKKRDWRFGEDNHLATVGELPVPVHRLPRTYINEILTKYAGITVEEMHTDWLTEALYIPETDCFYTFSSDFGPGTFYPCYGEKNGDIVTLWAAPAGYEGSTSMLTLQKSGENWHILSHQTVKN